MGKYIIILIILIFPACTHANPRTLHEKDYQIPWCEQADGIAEYVLKDKTRVDCLTDEYAIEFDFAKKWAESIGQALFYSFMTDKKPGIVLILKNKKDERYLKRLKTVTDKLKIKVWTIQNHHK